MHELHQRDTRGGGEREEHESTPRTCIVRESAGDGKERERAEDGKRGNGTHSNGRTANYLKFA